MRFLFNCGHRKYGFLHVFLDSLLAVVSISIAVNSIVYRKLLPYNFRLLLGEHGHYCFWRSCESFEDHANHVVPNKLELLLQPTYGRREFIFQINRWWKWDRILLNDDTYPARIYHLTFLSLRHFGRYFLASSMLFCFKHTSTNGS